MLKADLHVHTNSSDGLLSPKEIVEWAYKKRLKAIGITDHDTISGIDAAIEEARKYNIDIVPGIELSTEYEEEEIHILGYYFDYKSPYLNELLTKIYDSRYNRASKIIDKLNDIDVNISLEEVKTIADNGIIGRPHIARAMIEKGYISNIKEAFAKYIGKGEVAYVERYKLSCQDAVNLIKKLGGVPVIAHPGLLRNTANLSPILDMGIQGIEVFHSKHNDETVYKMLQIAHARKLIITGGSDCHGIIVNNEPILGNVYVDYNTVNELKKISKM